jgi:hypothetical protein
MTAKSWNTGLVIEEQPQAMNLPDWILLCINTRVKR